MKKKTDFDAYFNNQVDAAPIALRKFITHISVIEGLATKTCINYFRDIILFFRYIISVKRIDVKFEDDAPVSAAAPRNEDYIKIIEKITPVVDSAFLNMITKDDVTNFLFYLQKKGNSPYARNRRLSALKKFFRYCENEIKIIDNNPTVNIAAAKQDKKLPKYLTLEESNLLLDSIDEGDNYERNYCIITFFLNCGLRLSELVNIDIKDIEDDTLRIIGKGSKERILHLNNACMTALETYLNVRFSNKYFVKDKDALFISSNDGTRLTDRMVEKIVEKALKNAGLDGKGYSPHKLRHTAATLMYQYGNVDVLVLKDVLGHEKLDTTQIYTHTNSKQTREATDKNPLAHKNEN